MKRWLKSILKRDGVRALLCWIGAQYIRFVWLSGRWRVDNSAAPAALWEAQKPFIMAFWHGHLLMMPHAWRRGNAMHMLISQHRDGQLIARVISHFGLGTVAGSSSKGGSAALRAMLKALKAGDYVGITPDGPRGPRMRASDGIVSVARLAGVPILPCAFACSPRKVLRSWDRFQVALPFARGVILWGDPIPVPRDLDEAGLEAKRQELEAAMNTLAEAAARRVGVDPIPPAEHPEENR